MSLSYWLFPGLRINVSSFQDHGVTLIGFLKINFVFEKGGKLSLSLLNHIIKQSYNISEHYFAGGKSIALRDIDVLKERVLPISVSKHKYLFPWRPTF